MGFKDMADKAKDALGDVGEKAKDVGEKAKDIAGDVGEKAKDLAGDARDAVGNAAEAATEKIDDATGGKVPDSVKKVVDKIDGEDETPGDQAEA